MILSWQNLNGKHQINLSTFLTNIKQHSPKHLKYIKLIRIEENLDKTTRDANTDLLADKKPICKAWVCPLSNGLGARVRLEFQRFLVAEIK